MWRWGRVGLGLGYMYIYICIYTYDFFFPYHVGLTARILAARGSARRTDSCPRLCPSYIRRLCPFHLTAMAAEKESLCYLCTESPPVHAGRCKPCNALYGRARTSCKTVGRWEDFLEVSKEHRTQFYRHGHATMGAELKALIQETISESYSEREMEAWIKDGKYLDKEDMTKKYEGKPEQLKSIFLKTKTHYCDVRDVLLYEDPEYMSTKTSSKESSKDSKRQISSDRGSKASKVPKIIADGGEPEALSAGQIKMLDKEAEALSTPEKTLSDLLEEAGKESIKSLIAPAVLGKLNLAIASLHAQRTSIELSVENKNGDVPSIMKELTQAKSEAAKTIKIMKAQLVVAKSLAEVAAPAPAD